MAEGFERIETDSVVDLQLSVADSLELGAAAEDRSSDGDYREASDIFDGADGTLPIDADGAGETSVVAESPTSVPATRGLPLSDVPEVSRLSEQMLPQWSRRTDVDSSGDGRQVPTSVRTNISVHSAGAMQSASPVDSGSGRADNSVRPRSVEGSGRGQVIVNPLFGQVNYTAPTTGTLVYARHVISTDASVQGLHFTAIPPQSISTPIAQRPTVTVRQEATPPRAEAAPLPATTLAPGVFMSQFDGANTVPPPAVQTVMYPSASTSSTLNYGVPPGSAVPFSSGVPFGSAVSSHTAIPTGSAVPLGTGIPPNSAVTSVTPGLAMPATPAVPPRPPVLQTLSVPSVISSKMECRKQNQL